MLVSRCRDLERGAKLFFGLQIFAAIALRPMMEQDCGAPSSKELGEGEAEYE